MDDKSPSQRRYEKTRQGILNAARSLLLEEGLDAISMRTLADKVDYSPAALYKYFANKDEIIAALRQEAWALMANFEPDFPPGMSMADMFVHSGKNYIQFASQYPEYYLLLMDTTETGPDSMQEFVQLPNFIGLQQFAEAILASGEFELPEGYNAYHLALLSWFVVHGISLLRLTMMNKCQDEFETASLEVLEMLKDVFATR